MAADLTAAGREFLARSAIPKPKASPPPRSAPGLVDSAGRPLKPGNDVLDGSIRFCTPLRVAPDTPRKKWLIDGFAERGQMALIVARGGKGKSTLTLHLSLMCASGGEFAYWRAPESCEVLIVSSEDSLDDQSKRLDAAIRGMGLSHEILDRIHLLQDPDDIAIVRKDREAGNQPTQLYTSISDYLRAHPAIGLVIVDPFCEASSGTDEGNSDVRDVGRCIRQLARDHDVAAIVVHHSRKTVRGKEYEPDQDDARGASALVAMARSSLNLEGMGPTAAKKFGVQRPEEYVLTCMTKANHGPRFGARWLRMVPQEIGNGETFITFRTCDLERTATPVDGWCERHASTLEEIVRAGQPESGDPWVVARNQPKPTRLEGAIETRFRGDVDEPPSAAGVVDWMRASGWIHEMVYTDRHRNKTKRWAWKIETN